MTDHGPHYHGIHHASLLVTDLETSLAFYRHILGLTISPTRPDLGYPGAWLQVGAQQIHLMQLPTPDTAQGRSAHGGHDRHIALTVASIDSISEALLLAGVPFTTSRSGRSALFCRDPDGNALEFIQG